MHNAKIPYFNMLRYGEQKMYLDWQGRILILGNGKRLERYKYFIFSVVNTVIIHLAKYFHTILTLFHEYIHHFITFHNVPVMNYDVHTTICAAMAL